MISYTIDKEELSEKIYFNTTNWWSGVLFKFMEYMYKKSYFNIIRIINGDQIMVFIVIVAKSSLKFVISHIKTEF